jgi:hypothetical protein
MTAGSHSRFNIDLPESDPTPNGLLVRLEIDYLVVYRSPLKGRINFGWSEDDPNFSYKASVRLPWYYDLTRTEPLAHSGPRARGGLTLQFPTDEGIDNFVAEVENSERSNAQMMRLFVAGAVFATGVGMLADFLRRLVRLLSRD